jgi:S-adenosylmethionine hydrolase
VSRVVGFPVSARPIITLTTDFGIADGYVGAMKGVILSITPDATITDITHSIPPQDVAAAGHVLASAAPYFPAGTIHVAVVDPGVGTDRRALAVETARGFFIGPDNGVLCPSLAAARAVDAATGEVLDATAIALTNPAYFKESVSATFHGRDVFAPVAAHIARRVTLAELGSRIDRVDCADPDPPLRIGGTLLGRVVHIDHFGNAITNVRAEKLPRSPLVKAGETELLGLAPHYQAAPIIALVGSTGLLEISVRDGSAAKDLGLRVGDEVSVREAP